jgi:hypothetical protein
MVAGVDIGVLRFTIWATRMRDMMSVDVCALLRPQTGWNVVRVGASSSRVVFSSALIPRSVSVYACMRLCERQITCVFGCCILYC